MTISRAHMSTHRGDVIYLESVRWPVNGFTRSRSMFNLILSSHFGSAEKLIKHTYWISMLWCDSCQNRVSADQYHLTVSRAQDVQNEIQLLSGVFCYSWLVCLLGFWLSKSRKCDFGWHGFHFSPCLMRKRVEKSEAILALLDTFQGLISSSKPE